MLRRLLDRGWFLTAVGVTVGLLLAAGLIYDATPKWVRWSITAIAFIAPAAPWFALLPMHFLAVRRGLTQRSRIPFAISIADGSVIVERGAKRMGCELALVARARRAHNDNWTESKVLESAIGLFCVKGRELVRVPLSATGLDAVLRELDARKIPIEDVLVSAPAILD